MTVLMNSDDLVFPGSPGQQRLWFLHQMIPQSAPAYCLAVRATLTGQVDPRYVQQAINEVVERHEALRTALRDEEGRLVQIVRQGVSVTLQDVDLTALDADEAEAELTLVLQHVARRGWDLRTAPLMRAALVRVDAERSVLALCVHHAVCDGVSLRIVLDEIFGSYQRLRSGAPHRGEEEGLLLQFGDFVVWSTGGEEPDDEWAAERRALTDRWRDRLAGLPAGLDLGTDRRRPARQSVDGARLPVVVPADEAQLLRQRAADYDISVSSLLLTAFLVVLHRSSGAPDLAVGIPVSNRCRAELAGTVGYLANTCVLRSEVGSRSLLELARQTHSRIGELMADSDLPFSDLVEALSPPRLLDRNPLFSVLFSFQPDAQTVYELPGLRAEIADIDTATARLDLSLFLFEQRRGEIRGFLEYATALFDAATVQLIADRMRIVLERLVHSPHERVATVSLSDDQAPPWPMAGPPPAGQQLLRRVREHAERSPQAPALRGDDLALTYQELDARVTAAAGELARSGVRPGSRVAVHVERGAAVVVALLAIWQCGAVYVPLDPTLPEHRRRLIVERAAPSLIIHSAGTDLPVSGTAVQAVPAEELMAAPGDSSALTDPDPDSLAYLMFTSGSTGTPKGIAVSHRNLAYFLSALTEEVGLCRDDRLLALTTTAFDISLFELLGPLTAGGVVVIPPQEALRDGAQLRRRLAATDVTLAQATPATWRLALDAEWRPGPGFRVLCGGEALPADLADTLSPHAGAAWNLYGPTETTIWSCAARLRPGEVVHVGMPLSGTTAVVVDAQLNPVPTGVCGELLIGGPGVATGYLGNAALTAARFLPDPVGKGRRLYRTGDLARRRTDGTLEYAGRIDDQVKVRGFRIELGEVEHALRSAGGVRDAVAAVVGTGADAAVWAGLVPEQGTEPTPEWAAAARRQAAALLPEAALPARFRALTEIPLTPNGKVNRLALPRSGTELAAMSERLSPRNDTERAVADLWREVLDVPDLGVTDDFFALGGHSLLASRAIQLTEERLGVTVPVSVMFVEPTVAHIAQYVATRRGEPVAAAFVQAEVIDQ
ncbi:non-ribosomal peptide synthetase [Streptomyces yerevanensis]|uniref:non-ribosomal peptide synthetase n=1 Tax=Streptomyces yerevanensis TaxID=66378 RepID=UPI0005275A6C|nr:non-ribosomal peptide synthetase [Streptomyces yerevanensis]